MFRPADIAMVRNRVNKVVIDGEAAGELWPEQVGNLQRRDRTLVQVKIDFLTSNPLARDGGRRPWRSGQWRSTPSSSFNGSLPDHRGRTVVPKVVLLRVSS